MSVVLCIESASRMKLLTVTFSLFVAQFQELKKIQKYTGKRLSSDE